MPRGSLLTRFKFQIPLRFLRHRPSRASGASHAQDVIPTRFLRFLRVAAGICSEFVPFGSKLLPRR